MVMIVLKYIALGGKSHMTYVRITFKSHQLNQINFLLKIVYNYFKIIIITHIPYYLSL